MATGRMKRDDNSGKGASRRPDIVSVEQAQQEIRALSGKTSPSCIKRLVSRATGRKLVDNKGWHNASDSATEAPSE